MGKALADGNRRERVFLMTRSVRTARSGACAAPSSRSRCGGCGPITSTCGRFTSACTTTIRARHVRQGRRGRGARKAKRDGMSASSVSPATNVRHPPRDDRTRLPVRHAQMRLNVLDPNFRSFEKHVVPLARERGIKVIGMKASPKADARSRPKVGSRRRAALRDVRSRPADHGYRTIRSTCWTTKSASPTASPARETVMQALRGQVSRSRDGRTPRTLQSR